MKLFRLLEPLAELRTDRRDSEDFLPAERKSVAKRLDGPLLVVPFVIEAPPPLLAMLEEDLEAEMLGRLEVVAMRGALAGWLRGSTEGLVAGEESGWVGRDGGCHEQRLTRTGH